MSGAARRSTLRVVAVAAATPLLACGSDGTMQALEGVLPPILTPIACTSSARACSCEASDSGAVDASASLCDDSVTADASCCAGPDYPNAGGCTCAAGPCADGGAPVTSCSSPPAYIDSGGCDPATCSGSSCGGGECCTSACKSGACVQTCS